MNRSIAASTETRRNWGWVLVFAVGFLQTLSAVFLLAFSGLYVVEINETFQVAK